MKIIVKSLNYLSAFLATFIGALLLIYYLLPIFNINCYVVVSPSMEPDIKVGSIIFVDEVNINEVYNKISVGDDITYKISNSNIVTHRVVAIDEMNNQIQTKGIANETPDPSFVTSSQVIGKVMFNVPYLGYLLNRALILGVMFMIIFIKLFGLYRKEIKKN